MGARVWNRLQSLSATGAVVLLLAVACGNKRHGAPTPNQSGAGDGGAGTTQFPAESGTGGTEAPNDGGGGASDLNDGGTVSGGVSDGGALDGGAGGVAPIDCDDHNLCTVDTLSALGCSHAPVASGSRCDDGNPCTMGDQCAGAVCVGVPRSSAPEILARVESYGAFAFDQSGFGLLSFLSSERVIFADPLFSGTALTLARLDQGGTQPLSRIESPIRLSRNQISPWLWADRPLTQLVALGPNRLAFLATGGGIETYDVSSDKLVALASSGFGNARIGVNAAVGTPKNLWVCGNHGVAAYAIAEDGSASLIGNIAGLANCNGLARSPDGTRLYAATNTGLQTLTVAADGALTAETVVFKDVPFFNVRASSFAIALQEMRPQLGFSTIWVHRRSDFSEITKFATDTPSGLNLGMELFEDGILLERYRRAAGDHNSIVAEYYELDDAGAKLATETVVLDLVKDPEVTSSGIVQLDSSGSKVALQPLRRILDIDPNSRSLNVLPAVRGGSFERVSAISDHEVLASGAFSAHLIDISTPKAPEVVGGGALSAATQPLSVLTGQQGSRGAALLSFPRDSLALPLKQATDQVTLVSLTDRVPEIAGSFSLEGGPGLLATSGNSLFQFSPGDGQYHVRRIPIPEANGSGSSPVVSPEDWGTLDGAGPSAQRMRSNVVLNEAGDTVVLLDIHTDPTDALRYESKLVWYGAKGHAFRKLASSSRVDDSYLVDVRLAGERLAAVSSVGVQLLRRVDDRIELEASTEVSGFPENSSIERILGLYEDLIYVSVVHTSLFSSVTNARVLALRTADLGVAARYDLSEVPRSMTHIGSTIVFGTATQAIVAAPSCQ